MVHEVEFVIAANGASNWLTGSGILKIEVNRHQSFSSHPQILPGIVTSAPQVQSWYTLLQLAHPI